jgi:hypothetical protein
MIEPVGALSRIAFTPTDVTDLPRAVVQAEVQVAALKQGQDAAKSTAEALVRLIEPEKGNHIDRYA